MIVDLIRANQLAEAQAHARGEGIPTSLEWREARLLFEMEMLGVEVAHSPLSPSSIGGLDRDRKCTRQHVYRLLDFERAPVSARTFDAFRDGNYHEAAVLADIVTYSPWAVDSRQMKVETGDSEWGYIDGIARSPLGEEYLLEIKSTTGNAYHNMLGIALHGEVHDYIAGADANAQPSGAHVAQVQRLMAGLQKVSKIDKCLLIYKSKDTASLAEFIVPYDPTFAQGVADRVSYIKRLVADRVLPPREFRLPLGEEKGDWQCSYCAYRTHCAEGLAVPVAAPEPPELPASERQAVLDLLVNKSIASVANRAAGKNLKAIEVNVLQNLGLKTFTLDGHVYEVGATTIKEIKR